MSKRKERQKRWWASKTSEEKAQIQATRAAKAERDKFYEDKRKRRDDYDRTGDRAQIGDWLRYQEQEEGGVTSLNGKVCRIVDWDDDGFNRRRAGRNKKIIIEVEPHLYDNPRLMQTNFWGFEPANAMRVIAEAAR